MCAKITVYKGNFFGISGKFFVCLREVRDIRGKFLYVCEKYGLLGKIFWYVRKNFGMSGKIRYMYIRENVLVCSGKISW